MDDAAAAVRWMVDERQWAMTDAAGSVVHYRPAIEERPEYGNPFSRMAALQRAYVAQTTPDMRIERAKAEYVDGLIEVEEFERQVGEALGL